MSATAKTKRRTRWNTCNVIALLRRLFPTRSCWKPSPHQKAQWQIKRQEPYGLKNKHINCAEVPSPSILSRLMQEHKKRQADKSWNKLSSTMVFLPKWGGVGLQVEAKRGGGVSNRHDPFGGYPDLVEKQRFWTKCSCRGSTIGRKSYYFWICIFRGVSNATEMSSASGAC